MKATLKKIQITLILLLTLSLLSPSVVTTENHNAPRMSGVLSQMVAENPEQALRVIVHKATDSKLAEGFIKNSGGRVLKDLPMLDAFAAQVPAESVNELAEMASVNWVSLDAPVKPTGKPIKDPESTIEQFLENYFLDTLNVRRVWDMNYDGEGIGVAVIDSGIFTDRDFTITPNKPHTRIKVLKSFNSETPSDLYGHGTHVAGIIGGHGGASDGLYAGVAPKVDIISLKINDDRGLAYESDTVDAMQWVFDHKDEYNIRVLNLSIQSTVPQPYHESALDAAAEILWFNGVVVVAAAGNWNDDDEDDFKTIEAAPGNDPFIITVGATDEKGTSTRVDDVITSFTSFGKTIDGYTKPDIFAPGVDIISVLSFSSDWFYEHPDRVVMDREYFRLSGTSMAAPMVTGAAAILLQAEPNLTPDQVKYRLIHSAGMIESWPYLDIYSALTMSTSEAANQDIVPHMLLAKMAMIAYWSSQNGEEEIDWEQVNWDAVNWNAVNWNAVNWNAVNWNAVNWNAVNWNAVNWNAVNWNAVNWNAVNWNAANWNAVNWNAVNWNAVNWNAVNWNAESWNE
jgi:serine protease AprX